MNKKAVYFTRPSFVFPSFIRSITEYSFSYKTAQHIKVGVISGLSLYLIGMIFIEAVALHHNLEHQKQLEAQRVSFEEELSYWESITSEYADYRDAYYRVASLQLRMGDAESARSYLQKALELDPNFTQGQVLGSKIGLDN